jgi:MFS transporter, OFA family, oxalate/formate antiporter
MKRGWIVALAGLGVNLSLGTLYSWGVFSSTLQEQGWSATESQIPYMLACALFAALMVPGGRIQDKLGPKRILLMAAILTFVGFIFSGVFLTLIGISLFFGIAFGTAVGFGYAATIPTVIRWFAPSKRGLVSGIVVSGFGLAGIYVAPLTKTLIDRFGLRYTFILFGIVFSLLILFFRQIITLPPAGYIPYEALSSITDTAFKKTKNKFSRDYIWREMIRTPQFISLWVMFFASTFAGLMMIGIFPALGKSRWESQQRSLPLLS